MLKGNRKLAAIIAGLLAVVGLAALSIMGVSEAVVLSGLGATVTLSAGGALVASDN